MIFQSSLRWLKQIINQRLNSHKTFDISPSWASFRVSIMKIFVKIDSVIMSLHCSLNTLTFVAIDLSSPWIARRLFHASEHTPCRTVLTWKIADILVHPNGWVDTQAVAIPFKQHAMLFKPLFCMISTVLIPLCVKIWIDTNCHHHLGTVVIFLSGATISSTCFFFLLETP